MTDLKNIKFSIRDVVKIIGGTVTVVGIVYSFNAKLDKIEAKLDALDKISADDKYKMYADIGRLNRKVIKLEGMYEEGKDKVNRELTTMTDRLFNIYAVLPKSPKIEDEK